MVVQLKEQWFQYCVSIKECLPVTVSFLISSSDTWNDSLRQKGATATTTRLLPISILQSSVFPLIILPVLPFLPIPILRPSMFPLIIFSMFSFLPFTFHLVSIITSPLLSFWRPMPTWALEIRIVLKDIKPASAQLDHNQLQYMANELIQHSLKQST